MTSIQTHPLFTASSSLSLIARAEVDDRVTTLTDQLPALSAVVPTLRPDRSHIHPLFTVLLTILCHPNTVETLSW